MIEERKICQALRSVSHSGRKNQIAQPARPALPNLSPDSFPGFLQVYPRQMRKEAFLGL